VIKSPLTWQTTPITTTHRPTNQTSIISIQFQIITFLHISCSVALLSGQARKLSLKSAAGRGIWEKIFLSSSGGARRCCAARKQGGDSGKAAECPADHQLPQMQKLPRIVVNPGERDL
jgi:hypothetical protein